MIWFVYILNCRGGRLYTGVALDVALRFEAHLAGKGARFTRSFPPESILVQWPCANQRVALQLEYAIKQLSATDKKALAAGVLIQLSKPLRFADGIWYEPSALTNDA
ncbi:MAG: GIY-YIG nuclease family protein [Deefgea sp.]